MAFTSAGPERDAREIAAAQIAHTTQGDASNRYVTANIQDIREGDYVLATDPETGEQAPRKVVDAFSRVVNKLRILEVRTESGRIETIRTTDEHPFWVDEADNFLPAGDLEPGDSFHGPTGEKTTLVSTRSEDHPEGVVVYNFEVEGSHTYFVLAAGEDGLTGAGVLVHNATRRDCGGGVPRSTPRGAHRPATNARPLSERIRDFRANPEKWKRISASASRSSNRRAKGGVSIESTYRNVETGETIHVHDVFNIEGNQIPKHPSYRDYGKEE